MQPTFRHEPSQGLAGPPQTWDILGTTPSAQPPPRPLGKPGHRAQQGTVHLHPLWHTDPLQTSPLQPAPPQDIQILHPLSTPEHGPPKHAPPPPPTHTALCKGTRTLQLVPLTSPNPSSCCPPQADEGSRVRPRAPAHQWQRLWGDRSPDAWVLLPREERGQMWRRLREQHPVLVSLFTRMCPGWRGWRWQAVSRHHGKAWGEHHPAGETEAHTVGRWWAGGEGSQHVPPVSLPCHSHQGWQGGVAGAWRAGVRGGEGGWGGEEGEVQGCQNQLRAVQTPGQLCSVARETRHSWSTTGPCLPQKAPPGPPRGPVSGWGGCSPPPCAPDASPRGVAHPWLTHSHPIPFPARFGM